jgi:cytochrome c oxidase cbb3-type subunit 1
MSGTQTTYNDKVVRQFAVMTVIWGIVGMLVGVIIAAQLVWPELNMGFLHFGRLRPLHTNAVIFAFGGCALFATSYWCVQRTSHAASGVVRWFPLPSGVGKSSFLLAAITLPLGITQARNTPNWNGRLTS